VEERAAGEKRGKDKIFGDTVERQKICLKRGQPPLSKKQKKDRTGDKKVCRSPVPDDWFVRVQIVAAMRFVLMWRSLAVK
jgi:hypothetical protein